MTEDTSRVLEEPGHFDRNRRRLFAAAFAVDTATTPTEQ